MLHGSFEILRGAPVYAHVSVCLHAVLACLCVHVHFGSRLWCVLAPGDVCGSLSVIYTEVQPVRLCQNAALVRRITALH